MIEILSQPLFEFVIETFDVNVNQTHNNFSFEIIILT